MQKFQLETAQTSSDQSAFALVLPLSLVPCLYTVITVHLFLGFAKSGKDLWGCIVGFLTIITILRGAYALILGGLDSRDFIASLVDCLWGTNIHRTYTACVWTNITSQRGVNGFLSTLVGGRDRSDKVEIRLLVCRYIRKIQTKTTSYTNYSAEPPQLYTRGAVRY